MLNVHFGGIKSKMHWFVLSPKYTLHLQWALYFAGLKQEKHDREEVAQLEKTERRTEICYNEVDISRSLCSKKTEVFSFVLTIVSLLRSQKWTEISFVT